MTQNRCKFTGMTGQHAWKELAHVCRVMRIGTRQASVSCMTLRENSVCLHFSPGKKYAKMNNFINKPNRGGSRGRVQGVRTPAWDDLRFSNTTGILQKKTMWFIGVEVEQETSAPPPKKNPGSAPAKFIFRLVLPQKSNTINFTLGLPVSESKKRVIWHDAGAS